MAFSPSFRQKVKMALLTLLGAGLLYLGVFIYFGLVTIPYVSPVVLVVGNTLSPFTPLITPALAYCNIKLWLHPAMNAYRATLKGRRYATSLIPQYISVVMLVFYTLVKFFWVMERMYGLRADEGMCVGPCWKLWTELMLVAFVIFAVVMGWDLDGGIYWRFMDRQVEKLKQQDAEKAAKETAPVEDKTVLEI
jgi:hypothetical protein